MIQCQFLNALLDSGDASLITANNLNIEYFSDYKDEYNYITDHLDKYGTIPDKATFLTKFNTFDILDVKETPKYLVDALFEDRNKRHLAATFNKIRNYLNGGETEKALEVFTTSVEEVATAIPVRGVNLLRDLSRYNSYIERMHDFNRFFIKTGFPELDDIIGGWSRKNELAVIMARPGVGKSFVAIKSAVAAAEQGFKVGYYSGEMDTDSVGYRADSILSHLSGGMMAHGNEKIQNDYKKYLEDLNQITGSLVILTPQMIGGLANVNYLKAFIENENLDILFVDQYSLLEDIKGGRTDSERAANLSKELKKVQVKYQIPIIAISQQNRSEKDETGKATTANIALSDRIGQDASTALALEQKDGILTVYLTKSRNSISGKTFKYAIDLDKGIFNYIPEEGDEGSNVQCEQLHEQFDNYTPSGEDIF